MSSDEPWRKCSPCVPGPFLRNRSQPAGPLRGSGAAPPQMSLQLERVGLISKLTLDSPFRVIPTGGLPLHFLEDVETHSERKRESHDYSPCVERKPRSCLLHTVVDVVGHCYSFVLAI